MPLRYHKEIKLGDFIKLNMNKNSTSVSAGVPGLHFNIGPAGPMINVDLPGGLSYRKYFGKSKKDKKDDEAKKAEAKDASDQKAADKKAEAKQDQETRAEDKHAKEQRAEEKAKPEPTSVFPPPEPPNRRSPKPRLADAVPLPAKPGNAPAAETPAAQVPREEQPFQLGFIAYQNGEYIQAYRHFTDLIDSPYRSDALFMAGITSSYLNRHDEAETYLGTLLEEGHPPFPGDPESLVTRYMPDATVTVQVTPFSAVDLPLEPVAAVLLYVEMLALDNQLDAAAALVWDLFQQNPEFRLAQLALGNLYYQQERYDDIFNLFSQHTPELAAEDDAAVEIMYYWALALTTREMYDAADKVYKRALSRTRGINPDLRRMVMYGCADLYERWGKTAQARKGFEHVFAEAPDFYDVQQRIAALNEEQPVAQ